MAKHECVTRPKSKKLCEEEQTVNIATNFFNLTRKEAFSKIMAGTLFYETQGLSIHVTLVHE